MYCAGRRGLSIAPPGRSSGRRAGLGTSAGGVARERTTTETNRGTSIGNGKQKKDGRDVNDKTDDLAANTVEDQAKLGER